ncbi:MAG: lactonase family protein [Lachnospiraceae bacterium]|nr:lactonase family protein [Lachnospiraceae bacterium]
MASENYVAYVGTYTNGKSKGIHIYDVNLEEGYLLLRKVVPVNNSSYLCVSRNNKYLYSIADEGVAVYGIEDDGDLLLINAISIEGMRGCHLSTDLTGTYLFVSGYHDGKVSVVHTHGDGHLGSLVDSVFHRGTGALVERSFRPHVTCTRVTPDNKYICAVDEALDQIVIYRLNPVSSRLQQVDILRMGGQTGPKSIHFSKDGRFAFVLCQITSKIRVYSYHLNSAGFPLFELLNEYSTLSNSRDPHDAASSMRLSYDGRYIFASTAGDDSVACFSINAETGELSKEFALPTAGDYPKDLALFPDQKHMAVVNNATGSITTFAINYENKYITMKGKPKLIDSPNCILFHKIAKAPDEIRDVPEDEALDACVDFIDAVLGRPKS